MHAARSGDRNSVGGDRAILDRGIGFLRRGDRWLPDRWMSFPSSSPIIPASPSTFTGLTAWYKADALGLLDGAAVTSWTDSSANSHTLLGPGSGTTSPTFKAGIINGMPVVRFNGTTDGLIYSVGGNPAYISNGTPITAFTVFKQTKGYPTGYNGVGPMQSLGFNQSNAYGLGILGENNFAVVGNQNDGFSTVAGSTNLSGVWHMLSATSQPGASGPTTLYVDGVQIATGSYPNQFGLGQLYVGTMQTYNVPWGGDVAEMIIYNWLLPNSNRQSVEAYLRNKYATP